MEKFYAYEIVSFCCPCASSASGLLNQSAYRVMETEKAILLEFGNLIDADIEPGLHFKLPIAQEVKKFDARVLTLDSQGETYYTLEKKPLIVDSFVKWRVADIERLHWHIV